MLISIVYNIHVLPLVDVVLVLDVDCLIGRNPSSLISIQSHVVQPT